MKCFPLMCTVSIRLRFSDIRRSWLRIVTDIIFCIHGISLLNKIKDQNLEFEEKNTRKKKHTQPAHDCLYFQHQRVFFSLPSLLTFHTVTHISFILQRHSRGGKNSVGITLLTFQGPLPLRRCEENGPASGEGSGVKKKKKTIKV